MTKIKDILNHRWGAYSLAAFVGVLTYLLFARIPDFFSWLSYVINLMAPIIIGIVIAYLIDLIVVFFERKVFKFIKPQKVRSVVSVIISPERERSI